MSILVESGGGVPIVNPTTINVTPSVANQEFVPSGSYTALKEVMAYGDANLLPKNIADGVEIFGVQGSMYQSISSTASAFGLGIEFSFSFSGTLDINKIRGVFIYKSTYDSDYNILLSVGAQLQHTTPPKAFNCVGTSNYSSYQVTFSQAEYTQSLVAVPYNPFYYFGISNNKLMVEVPTSNPNALRFDGDYTCVLIYEK